MDGYYVPREDEIISLNPEQPNETNQQVEVDSNGSKEPMNPWLKQVVRPVMKATAGIAALPAGFSQIGVDIANAFREPEDERSYEDLQKSHPKTFGRLPTYKQAVQNAEELVGEDLTAETPLQDSIDRGVTSFAMSLLGGKMAMPERVLLAGGGEAFRRAAKAAGRSDTTANLISLAGELGMSSAYHTYGLYKSIPKVYAESFNYLAPGEKGRAAAMKTNIDDFIAKHEPNMVGHPDVQLAVSKAKEILKKIEKNDAGKHVIDLRGAVDSKQSVNKLISTTKEGKQLFKELSGIMNEGIAHSRATNPKFYDSYRKADDLFAAFHGRTMLEDAIKKNKTAQKAIKSPVVKSLVKGTAFGSAAMQAAGKGFGAAGLVGAGAITGGVAGIYKLSDILMKNATARKHFMSAAKNMRNYRIADAIQDYVRLDEDILKEDRYRIPEENEILTL